MRQTIRGLIPVVVVLGCTDPATTPSYMLEFHNGETFSYEGSGCVGNPNTLYCGTWNADPYTFSGVLQGDPADNLVVNGVKFGRDYQPGESVRLKEAGTSCHLFTITGQQDDTFSGTFYEQTDCHGAGRRGTFTAVRADVPG